MVRPRRPRPRKRPASPRRVERRCADPLADLVDDQFEVVRDSAGKRWRVNVVTGDAEELPLTPTPVFETVDR